MSKDQSVLAVITARGGSKGIKDKNIKPLAGQPLIAWTIQACLNSNKLDRIITSTDKTNIADICLKYGVEVPFIRPNDLAQNDSPHIDVIIHAVDWLSTNCDYNSDYVLLLQPTSPLRSTEDINKAIELAMKYNADSVISVCKAAVHPYLNKQINKDGNLSDFIDKPKGYLPRQLHPPVYYLNGAIYLIKTEVIQKQRTFFPDSTIPYIMPVERSLDIDTIWDFYLCDLVLRDKLKYSKT